MVNDVLARPIYREVDVDYTPDFSDDDYHSWRKTNRDLPQGIIDQLAEHNGRNQAVADYYAANQSELGKTLVFADRWYQCVAIEEALEERGVRAGSVFSQVDLSRTSATERNRRDPDENDKNIAAFKAGDLDVLVNIRMLTEGTDVPDAKTVFLTRKTTSRILLTQMVGRALRGPKFGGTDEAFIVSFVDDWQQVIHWAEFDELEGGLADEPTEYGERAPVQLIRVDLVRKLARQMDTGQNVNDLPYTSLLPVGWYRAEYDVAVEGDQIEPRRELLVVFDHQNESYHQLISELEGDVPVVFEEEAFEDADSKARRQAAALVDQWVDEFFNEDQITDTVRENVRRIARHMGQSHGIAPRFFPFEARQDHDLDLIAQRTLDERLPEPEVVQHLKTEYRQSDKLWRSLYTSFIQFKNAFEAARNFKLGLTDDIAMPGESTPEPEPRWFTEEQTAQMKKRDGAHCAACGHEYALQADHIRPFYFGGQTKLSNSQILCTWCNQFKADRYINFRDTQTDLPRPHSRLETYHIPNVEHATDMDRWESFIRRTVNFFYEAGAVCDVDIASRGERLRTWTVELYAGNDPDWIQPYLEDLAEKCRNVRREANASVIAPEQISVVGVSD
jgi:hypothetical protein